MNRPPWPDPTGPSCFSSDLRFVPLNKRGQSKSEIASDVVSAAVERGESPGTIDTLNNRETKQPPAHLRPTRS